MATQHLDRRAWEENEDTVKFVGIEQTRHVQVAKFIFAMVPAIGITTGRNCEVDSSGTLHTHHWPCCSRQALVLSSSSGLQVSLLFAPFRSTYLIGTATSYIHAC
jgi:hypothetical protein